MRHFARYLSSILSSLIVKVLVVSRHGVRGPYGPDGKAPSEANLQPYFHGDVTLPTKGIDWGTSTDPNELVRPKLTPHGEQAIRSMGQYFRTVLYSRLLSNAQSACSSQVFAYADDNERDNVTAVKFFEGFVPECPIVSMTHSGSNLLFDQGQYPCINQRAFAQT